MTTYQIEIRAVTERYDVHAHQLAREIAQLSTRHLPTLTTISDDAPPFSFRTAQLYHLTGNLTPAELTQLSQQLLTDMVVQEAVISSTETEKQASTTLPGHIIDVFFHAGVTDTLAESVMQGAQMLGIAGLEHVETGRRYILDSRLSVDEGHTIASSLLYNPIIQMYTLAPYTTDEIVESGADRASPVPTAALSDEVVGSGADRASPVPTATLSDEVVGSGADRASPVSMAALSDEVVGAEADRASPVPTAALSDEVVEAEAGKASLVSMTCSIPLMGMDDEQLLAVSKEGLLSLNLQEMRTIQQHYQSQQREPTDVELETIAQTWSEHCSHKTFKATVLYRELDQQENVVVEETIKSLLKQYIMRATEQVRPDWLVSAFSDNAGIIRLTETQDIAFKVETHNHPSAIEPFGGANTGVGGVIRDILGVSAQPIACTDVLCFGPLDTVADELPAGVLSPQRIASGVVSGVRDYGNKMGIPTVNGAVLYHHGYIFNPLVFCGCLGILPHGSHPNNVQPGDLIVSLGGRTGRDGVHGATFSSGEMSLEINTQAGAAVQIGAPITEKKVSDVIIQARDRQLYHAITDCGAGGFSSAIGEMASKTGAYVELERVPLKYQGLKPWEIWLSEAQERMILAVPPTKLDELLALCAIEEVEASVLGHFTADHRLKLTYHGTQVADMDMDFLHNGLPGRTLEAVWTRSEAAYPVGTGLALSADQQAAIKRAAHSSIAEHITSSLGPTLLALLSHPNIASKEEIIRRYDHEVQGATVLKPLVGRSHNGPSDAAVLEPSIESRQTPRQARLLRRDNIESDDWHDSHAGIVISNGINPLYGKFDPYHMAVTAVDEALRNLTAVGGDIRRVAILDNFCWGNPTDPAQMGGLVRAVKGCYDAVLGFGTPFISGKDSLNNEYRTDGRRIPVIATLLISAIGVIDDAARTIDMSLKTPGNLLYLIGQTRYEMAGSYYGEVIDPDSFEQLFPSASVPQVDLQRARTTMIALGDAIRQGLVHSCHDLSEGGLVVAAAEMALAGQLGVNLDTTHVTLRETPTLHPNSEAIVRLFSETPSRFLVEITPEQFGTFEKYMRDADVQDVTYVGTVTGSGHFVVRNGDEELINLGVDELQAVWKGKQV